MIEIDGTMGEGGGQVLRSALTLSILTRQSTCIKNIRARREQPGLLPQHLKAIDAAAAVSKAQVEGAHHGSTMVIFKPDQIRSGRYRFDIGTAGSTSLILQTIFLPLSMATSASTVIISGGTHVPWSPCYHFLAWHWLEMVKRIGFSAEVSLDQAGFYPQGGGRITATIRPAKALIPLNMVERGRLTHLHGLSAVANLDMDIAERQKRRALNRLQPQFPDVRIKIDKMPSRYKGTVLLLIANLDTDNGYAQCCYYALGQLGKPAERVADEALDAFFEFNATSAAVDQYLADQLLLPLAFAQGESRIHTSRITQHLLTNAEVIRAFLPLDILVQGELGQPGLIHIIP